MPATPDGTREQLGGIEAARTPMLRRGGRPGDDDVVERPEFVGDVDHASCEPRHGRADVAVFHSCDQLAGRAPVRKGRRPPIDARRRACRRWDSERRRARRAQRLATPAAIAAAGAPEWEQDVEHDPDRTPGV
jgi:hypothetical protein